MEYPTAATRLNLAMMSEAGKVLRSLVSASTIPDHRLTVQGIIALDITTLQFSKFISVPALLQQSSKYCHYQYGYYVKQQPFHNPLYIKDAAVRYLNR